MKNRKQILCILLSIVLIGTSGMAMAGSKKKKSFWRNPPASTPAHSGISNNPSGKGGSPSIEWCGYQRGFNISQMKGFNQKAAALRKSAKQCADESKKWPNVVYNLIGDNNTVIATITPDLLSATLGQYASQCDLIKKSKKDNPAKWSCDHDVRVIQTSIRNLVDAESFSSLISLATPVEGYRGGSPHAYTKRLDKVK